MKLKVGDRVLCTNTFGRYGPPHKFTKGNYYHIYKSGTKSVTVRYNSRAHIIFHLEPTPKHHYFFDYFITNQQLRKLKLNEIESR